MAESPIVVEGVGKVYEPYPTWLRVALRSPIREAVVALDDVSLDVPIGRICAVVGPNGAGKSTLFRILTGLTTPTSGRARVLGYDCVRQAAQVRRVVGWMPSDDRSLLLRHTCMENLIFHGRMQGMDSRRMVRKAEETLDLVGILHAKDRAGFALSAGMRARLQLARAIMHEPQVLILDEPTGTLDPVSSYELVAMIQRLTEERGLSVLLSSHRLEDIETLHDKMLLLDKGSVVYLGPLDDLRQLWDSPRLELRFHRPEMVATAVDRLKAHRAVTVEVVDPPKITICTERPVGEVIPMLEDSLEDLAAINETRLPLRELLNTVLTRGGED